MRNHVLQLAFVPVLLSVQTAAAGSLYDHPTFAQFERAIAAAEGRQYVPSPSRRADPTFDQMERLIRAVQSGGGGPTGGVGRAEFGLVTNDLWSAIRFGKSCGSARLLPEYLWKAEFSDSYESDARWYYDLEDRSGDKAPGMCSARRRGGVLERNYDWYRDNAVEFVVLTEAGPGRFASVGVANIGERLTEEFVSSGKPSRFYKCLPGRTVDGVNENGVAIEVNVVVTNGSKWEVERGVDGRDIDSRWAVRYALDGAPDAEWAATNLANRVYVSKALMRMGYSVHYVVVDRDSTWLVEDGNAIPCPDGFPLVSTNFRLDAPPPKIFGNDPYGAGYERYFLLTNDEVAITDVWYSNAYRRDANGDFPWPTEFAGQVDPSGRVLTNTDTDGLQAWAKANIPVEVPDEAFPRGVGLWQTVHTSIYDVSNLTLRVAVQERDDWYAFQVPSSGRVSVSEQEIREVLSSLDAGGDIDWGRYGTAGSAIAALIAGFIWLRRKSSAAVTAAEVADGVWSMSDGPVTDGDNTDY